MNLPKFAIITTHPIQYYAPIFRLLASRGNILVKVFYTWSQAKGKVWDIAFNKEIQWDIPLLEGYDFTFVENTAKHPGLGHFMGLVNPELIRLIENWNPDAVLVIGWNYLSHLKVMRHLKKKIPVYFRGDSTLLDEKHGIKKIIRRLFLTRVYRNIDFALYVGANNKEYYRVHGVKEQQLIFSPHAVNNEYFSDNSKMYEKEAIEARRRMGISDDSIVILFAGKFEYQKNLEVLIEAVQTISRKKINNKIHLILVGGGILESRLRNLALDSDNIHFLPFQNQSRMPIVYRMGDVFCLPSQSETWGLSVNEAMACGRAVIVSSKVGCAADLVENKDTGFIFENNNCDQLVSIINYIEQNPGQLKELGIKSQNYIQNFSFLNIARSIENTIISQ